jgi:hypothetical protein
METKFQTSFIPKKPITSTIGAVSMSTPVRHHTSSLFMSLATLVFIASIAAAGSAYAWKHYLTSAQVSLKETLATREKQFNVDLIEQLKAANIKIDLARRLLNNHLALSQIFDILGRVTIENVRFLGLDATVPTSGSDGVKVSLQGYGTSLSAVAFQSDVLGQLDQYGLRKIVKNPILSNPSLSADGSVSFGFTATIDPGSLSYERAVSPTQTQQGTNNTPGATGSTNTTNGGSANTTNSNSGQSSTNNTNTFNTANPVKSNTQSTPTNTRGTSNPF